MINATYIFENPSCGVCEFWEYSESESKLRGAELGRCDNLDNDFCCGGHEEHEAGCLGGGNFISKRTFWCKFWSQR